MAEPALMFCERAPPLPGWEENVLIWEENSAKKTFCAVASCLCWSSLCVSLFFQPVLSKWGGLSHSFLTEWGKWFLNQLPILKNCVCLNEKKLHVTAEGDNFHLRCSFHYFSVCVSVSACVCVCLSVCVCYSHTNIIDIHYALLLRESY